MKLVTLAALAAVSSVAWAQSDENLPQAEQSLPMNRPVSVNGITAECTGIAHSGDDSTPDGFPVRVEFANDRGEYTAGADVTVSRSDGRPIAQFGCPANWVLLGGLPPEEYKVTATIAPGPGGTESARFRPPERGHERVVLHFTSPAAD
ncbi:MAG: hypothetical protein KGJ78_11710 [Alphaproteobacteria bacterium]|nr:hypothetical protein [Alphaproteobacteria bacterium]